MMDRNREARRAVAMANGLHRRRHRTSNHRDSPEDEGAMGIQEAARLRDRTVKDRDREMRDRERDRERMSRNKRRRADGGGRGGGLDESSEESVNDDEDYVDDGGGGSGGGGGGGGSGGGVSQLNQVHMTSSPVAMSLTSQRKSYPPPTKVYRVTPTWKAPDEMIGVSIPRKARSASTKRSHEWSSCGLLESSSSPMRSDTAAGTATGTRVPSPSSAPMSPSSSNVSLKKKIKPNGVKHRPPKPASKSSPSIQDEIEIEVAEVLYGLMRQTQAPTPTPVPSSSSKPEPIHDSTAPVTFVAPKRKRPRLYPDEVQPGVPVISPNSNSNSKPESNHPLKLESASPSADNGGQFNSRGSVPVPGAAPVSVSVSVPPASASDLPPPISNNGNTMSTPKLEEVASSSSPPPPPPPQPPKLESSHNQDPLQFSSTSTKPNSTDKENRRGDKFKIDLMAPASPEKEEETGEYNGREVRDEKSMVTEREQDTKSKPNPNVVVEQHPSKQPLDSNSATFGIGIGIGIGIRGGPGGGGVELNRAAAAEAGDDSKASVVAMSRSEPHHKMTLSLSSPPPQQQQQQQQLPNLKERSFDLQFDLEKNNDSKLNVLQQQPKQLLPKTSSRDDSPFDKPGVTGLPMSVAAGWPGGIASQMGYVGPMQGVVSMDGTTTMAPPPIQPTPPHFLLSQPKPKRCATHCHIARSISLHQRMMKISPFWPPVPAAPMFGAKPSNMSLAPSAELHSGRGGVASLAQESKVQPLAFFPGQPSPVSNSKDKTSQAANVAESPQKKQMLLQPGLPPGAATNMMPAPALFFPMGQQQAAASARPGSGKSQSTASAAASASTLTSLPMGAAVSNAPPAMSFSYPNMNGSEAPAQFMAILGNGSYPFPIPAHVGAAAPYRGSHPQAMPFFNGSFYPSQMLHPSQLQQTQNHQNPGISSAPSTSSHKHLQNQQQRPQGSGGPNLGNPNQNSSLQNLQTTKSRDMGGEDSPTTADSRNRPNMSVYGPNFVVPFHSPSFALMPSSLGGGNHGDKKHQQQQQQQQQQSQHSALNSPFPMSFATINGATTPGLDISSMSMPEAAKYSYQMMAAAAQAAQQGKTDYRGPENGKLVAGDASNLDEERRAMPSRASTGQSIAFSRDTAENAVVDSSTRSLKQQQQQQQQQQQSQILFSKQQQYTSPSSGSTHSKTPSTSNRNVYPDNQTSSTIMGAKFTSNLSGYPSGGPTQSQWKNSVRPNTSQMSTPSITATSSPLNVKSLPQQQGRSQNQTHISFGASQGQQTHSSSHGHAPVGSPSNSSISKSTGGSPRTSASNKSLGQQGKNSPSQTQSAQKSSILGSPHMVSSTGSAGKPLLQQPHQQPQLSKQSIQQAQLYFSNYMQANTSAAMVGTGYYLQQQQQQQLQQRQLQQHMQQQLQGSKSKGSAPPISSTTCSPVTTSDPSKPLGIPSQLNAAAANNNNNNSKGGGLHSLGMFQTAQSSGGSHQLTPASFPYLNVVPPAVPVKPSDQKQPAGD